MARDFKIFFLQGVYAFSILYFLSTKGMNALSLFSLSYPNPGINVCATKSKTLYEYYMGLHNCGAINTEWIQPCPP
jgi:hypothetical protein